MFWISFAFLFVCNSIVCLSICLLPGWQLAINWALGNLNTSSNCCSRCSCCTCNRNDSQVGQLIYEVCAINAHHISTNIRYIRILMMRHTYICTYLRMHLFIHLLLVLIWLMFIILGRQIIDVTRFSSVIVQCRNSHKAGKIGT